MGWHLLDYQLRSHLIGPTTKNPKNDEKSIYEEDGRTVNSLEGNNLYEMIKMNLFEFQTSLLDKNK